MERAGAVEVPGLGPAFEGAAAQVGVLAVEEEAFVEAAELAPKGPADHQRRAGDVLDGPRLVAAEVAVGGASEQPLQPRRLEEQVQRAGEGARRRLVGTVGIGESGGDDTGGGMLLEEPREGADGRGVDGGVAVQEQEVLPTGGFGGEVVRPSEAEVLPRLEQGGLGILGGHHLG